MNSSLPRLVQLTPLLAAVVCASIAGRCAAETIDFESPTYTLGNLIGQDDWAKNAYFGDLNGDVLVSGSSPLSGGQSLSYTQTIAGGFSDISKANAILVSAGVSGADVTLSYVIKATASIETPVGGLFLGAGAGGGASPIFARVNGGILEVGSAGAIVPINSFFFEAGERIKMTYEVDFDNSTMNFIAENLDFGETFSQSYPFFAPYGSPSGPNGEYQVDVGAFLRGGNVQIDDIVLTAGVGPLVTDYEWTATGSGNWNQATNWTPTGIPGVIAGRQTARLGSSIAANQTIFNNSVRNLISLEIDNANSYAIAGVGSLEFQADASGPATILPSITVAQGSHQLQLAVNLQDDTTIVVAAGASLDLNNQINLNGHTLTTSGTVRINNSTIGGGSVVSAGALQTASVASFGGDLTSTGAMLVSVDENGGDFFQVAGNAILSGILDVVWDATSLPTGPITVLSAGGSLDATALSLAANDAKSFALSVDGNNLTLTFLGVAVPEPTTLGLAVVGLAGAIRFRRNRRLPKALVAAVVLLGSLATGPSARAANFTFESPTYSPGTLIGQDRWATGSFVLADPFFGGVVNGTVEVSTNAPLAGSQSVLYTQTIDPPTAGGTGASDVARPFSVFAVKDGTSAVDLTASFQIKADANGVGNGHMGFFLGEQGRSPVLIQISNVNSGSGTGDISVGHDFVVPVVGSYVANSVYEFSVGVDVDNQNYEAFSRNVTAGTPAVQLIGPGTDGRFPFFGGAFGDDGDGQTFTFDTTMILRSGTGRIDNITAVGDDFTQAVWVGGSGAWGTNTAWIPNMIPNAAAGTNGQTAIFGPGATTPQTVFTNSVQTVNGLRFDNVNKYAIAGQGSVALKANTLGGTVNPTISVLAGSHELQLPVTLLDNTTVTVTAGAQLDVNNYVALGGKTLTTSGALNLNVGVTGGGSIVNSGTLGTAGTTPFAAHLISTGKLAFDLGSSNIDFFNISGNATLSGLIDITVEPGYSPTGSYTLLTVSGTLNTAGLALDPSDAAQFTLGISGKSLVLTVGGSTSIPGDFTGNGTVDGADLAKWKLDFGTANGSDANGDGRADGNDFLIWQRNYGRTSAVPAAASVPEPTSIVISGGLACLGLLMRRRRRYPIA